MKTVAVVERTRTLTDAMPDEVLARIADRVRLVPMLSGASSLRSRSRKATLVVRTPDEDIEVSAPTTLLDQVFEMCDGTRTIGEILDTVVSAAGRRELAGFMDFLLDQGALIDANLAGAAAARYGFQFSPVGQAAELALTDQICRRFQLQKSEVTTPGAAPAAGVVPPPLAPFFGARLSTHTFDDSAAIGPQALDQLLWSLAGVVHLQHPRLGEGVPHRTVASAGGMYLVEVFVALRHGVGAHAPGVYRVRYPGERVVALDRVESLVCKWTSEPTGAGHDLLPTAFTKPWELMHAAGAIFLAADPAVAALRYRSRSLQYLFMEAGAMLHNGALSADGLGFGYATIGGYYEEPIARLCRLERQLVLGAAIFGARPTAEQLAMAEATPRFEFGWNPRRAEGFELGFHVARASVTSEDGEREEAWGRDADPWRAATKALAEAIERQGMHEPRGLVDGSLDEVDGAIDPRWFLGQGTAVAARRKVGADADAREPHSWVAATDLVTGRPVRVLAALVYSRSSLEARGHPVAPGAPSASSSGCAAGVTREDALWRGLLELVERDAFMRHWIARVPGQTLAIEARRPAIRAIAERVAALQTAGCRVSLQRLASDRAHVALVSAQHAGRHFTTLGCAASMDMVDALGRALDELEARVHAWLSGHVPAIQGPADVRGPDHHFDLYGLKRFFRRADRVLFPEPADVVVPVPRALRRRGVDELVACFARDGIHPVAVDITPRRHCIDQGRTPLTVAKVLVPGLQPLTFGCFRDVSAQSPRVPRGSAFPHPFP